jgi:hypothetical protein
MARTRQRRINQGSELGLGRLGCKTCDRPLGREERQADRLSSNSSITHPPAPHESVLYLHLVHRQRVHRYPPTRLLHTT